MLATKQPAMTAATLAGILRDHQGTERAEEIVDYAALISRSQLAAAFGNVGAVALGCYVFDAFWRFVTGHAWMAVEEAEGIYHSLSPVNSGTVFYAALTGLILWLASLAGGWLDNWGAYHQLPRAIAAHPLGRRLGRDRLARWAESVHENLSGWGTNVSLGFMLGMTPALGAFFGLPLDVRHVTLNSGILSLAASGLGLDFFLGSWFARALVGVAVMFVLNLGVSFLLSFYTAARAYGFAGADVWELAARHRPPLHPPPRATSCCRPGSGAVCTSPRQPSPRVPRASTEPLASTSRLTRCVLDALRPDEERGAGRPPWPHQESSGGAGWGASVSAPATWPSKRRTTGWALRNLVGTTGKG